MLHRFLARFFRMQRRLISFFIPKGQKINIEPRLLTATELAKQYAQFREDMARRDAEQAAQRAKEDAEMIAKTGTITRPAPVNDKLTVMIESPYGDDAWQIYYAHKYKKYSKLLEQCATHMKVNTWNTVYAMATQDERYGIDHWRNWLKEHVSTDEHYLTVGGKFELHWWIDLANRNAKGEHDSHIIIALQPPPHERSDPNAYWYYLSQCQLPTTEFGQPIDGFAPLTPEFLKLMAEFKAADEAIERREKELRRIEMELSGPNFDWVAEDKRRADLRRKELEVWCKENAKRRSQPDYNPCDPVIKKNS